ncbi:MAG: hypothetical protein MUC95_08770, partial [Spirochaetes bacterium]|nr:hypothetical protein [Spirochaetota bacterium]
KKKHSVVELIISDNGIGLPPEFDINKLITLGLYLVPSFVNQLNGTFRMNHKKGAGFAIEFPLNIQ